MKSILQALLMGVLTFFVVVGSMYLGNKLLNLQETLSNMISMFSLIVGVIAGMITSIVTFEKG